MLNNTQNSINTNYTLQQSLQDKELFNKFIEKPQKVTCDSPLGYLVHENIFQQFGSAVTDTFRDVKNLGTALKDGKSDDTKLGRMNDLGMKVGGGLIAGALMGARSTTNKKLMEVAGFATFFSAMSLWPKLAIDLPTKLRYGFNPHQKYVNSNGAKKAFFLDNQFLPWDIWSKEEINAVANKMGVDKNMENREEFTKEKMRTIALQDNTLWMLTAGFATPLLTSLACNRIEEYTRVPIANANLLKLEKQAQAPVSDTAALLKSSAKMFTKQDEEFKQVLTSLRNGQMPEDITQKLGNIFDVTRFANNEQVSKKFGKNTTEAAADLVDRIFTKTGSYDDFASILSGNDPVAKDLFNRAFQDAKAKNASTDIKNIVDRVNGIIDADPDAYLHKEWVQKIADGFDGLPSDIQKIAASNSAYSKQTLVNGADKLEAIYNEGIKPAQAQFHKYGAQIKKLDGISGEKYNRTARAMLEALDLNSKELELLRNTDETAGTFASILTQKIKEIANDDVKYHKTMAKLHGQSNKFETATNRLTGQKVTIKGVFDRLTGKTNEVIASLASKIDNDGSLSGSIIKKSLQNGISDVEAEDIRTNITSVNSMITKLTESINLERKIKDGTLLADWAKYAKENGLEGNTGLMSADECEKFYNLCRKVCWQSSYGDAMNKFYLTGNGSFYKALNETIFSGQNASLETKNWLDAARNIAFDNPYVPNDSLHIKNAANETAAYVAESSKSHSLKFADFGESVLNTFKKQIDNMYNDKKWMKIFGTMAGVLVGVTLVSQLFFGKVKNAHLYQTKNNGDSFEGGKK